MTTKELAQLVDRRYRLREKRYTLQHRADALKAEETQIDAAILAELSRNGTTTIGGRVAWCEKIIKNVPQVTDWPKLYAYITRTKEFDLLHRRISDQAVRARWEQNVGVPGVAQEQVATLSLHKVTA